MLGDRRAERMWEVRSALRIVAVASPHVAVVELERIVVVAVVAAAPDFAVSGRDNLAVPVDSTRANPATISVMMM